MTEPKNNKPAEVGPAPVPHINLGSPLDSAPGAEAAGDQVAALQASKEALENKLLEERFVWVLVITILFNVLFLVNAQNWTAPIVIGVLQLVGLFVLAQKCRVDPIMPLLDKFMGAFNGRGN
ncbi:hypothetical protein KD146_13500 [Devosia sp. BSSL-BM10]|uniref:Uncharacterized protein n=1 Tax=Devosia litorisediminis TaxID=2829817 RepID=A0A942IEI5_9HYPH|nr:hypothetical protein [Devosia litorisediminis]MBS3849714.1 hypothetical protein [Devosia litorisediminis]